MPQNYDESGVRLVPEINLAVPLDSSNASVIRTFDSSTATEPVVTLILPIATGVIIGQEDLHDMFRVLEAQFGRHPQSQGGNRTPLVTPDRHSAG